MQTVELETIVHKIHMGRFLPSVQAGGSYTINGTHDYSKAQYPGALPAFNPAANGTVPVARTSYGRPADCLQCHDQSNPAMTESTNWQVAGRACFSCHDTTGNTAPHAGISTSACVSCHTATDVGQYHYGK
jgi:hypothetical protein